jgi:hypothetical protein
MASSINASTSGAGGVITTADNTGILNIQTAGTNAVTVNASQNVGIGTASPSYKLDARASSGIGVQFLETSSGNTNRIQLGAGSGLGYINADAGSGSIALAMQVAGTERMRIDSSGNLLFNSGYGSVATAYGCRAWVNFNGTGTVAIRASGNVSSITDNGTGNYTINFTTALPDANYAVCGAGKLGTTQTNPLFGLGGTNQTVLTSSAVQVITLQAATDTDLPYVLVAIFR